MAIVTDPTGMRWAVYRRLWPFGVSPMRGAIMSGDSAYGLVQLIFAMPALVIWPFWLVTRLCGAPWTVVVAGAGCPRRTERICGWAASGRRVDVIATGLRIDGRVSLPSPVLGDH